MKTRYSLTETAKIIGVSRSTLYKKYLNTGVLSRHKDSNDKAYIDASELARVCPDADFSGKKKSDLSKLKDVSWSLEDSEIVQHKTMMLDEKEREIKRLHEELKWHKEQIENLQARLEYKPVNVEPTKSKKSGLLARLAKAVLDE